jgi:hypothetical protein
MNYLDLLKNSYDMENSCGGVPASPLEYLGEYVFDFTTYDTKMLTLFTEKAIEVCAAITQGTAFGYIKNEDNYRWYLLMCNMPFFASKLEWGTSIRGAWWAEGITLHSCGLWDGDKQITDLEFTPEEWIDFVRAIVEFSKQ